MHTLQITTLLFFIAVAITSGKQTEERHSRLILEYDWPEPKKNLQRFPHATSCSHFYFVRPDGSQTVKKCPANELFDSRTLRCREKTSAKCWNDLLKKGPTRITKKKDFKCPFPWGLYPDTEDCTMFYDCLSGRPYARKCPISTLFDKVERTCVEESEAMCADRLDVVEDDYECPFKWGYFTYSKDCSKYYECLRKIPSLRTCKKNMLFDNFKRKCMPMSTVECGDRFNPHGNGRKATEVPTGHERMTTERIPTGPERMSTDRITTGPERMTTDRITTSDERITTDRITTGPERMTTDRITTRPERMTTDRIPTGRERMTTDRITTRPERMSTDRITTGPERMTTDRIPTGRKWVTTATVRFQTEGKRKTTELISTEGESATTNRFSTLQERMTTESPLTVQERVTTDRFPTGRDVVTTYRMSTGRERLNSESMPNEREIRTTERSRTASDRKTTGHIHTGSDRMKTVYFITDE